ncbi:uncharacterized protein LOC107852048 [Capsicum annuum]|uniref:uncharacterized protein LOC107852048 n=1 Tax=Capsicum annuum TaxID=4072 RepID=UPI0007BF29A9|nr:uncharacterized protein LOC107852048 [Capsicum annuum]
MSLKNNKREEYDKISTCETKKEIWDELEITYEGTNKVKKSKTVALVNEYESFKMEENEDIETMFHNDEMKKPVSFNAAPTKDKDILEDVDREGMALMNYGVRQIIRQMQQRS